MNPQNRGEHINLRHSHLWRKSMFINKPVPQPVPHHKQLNELGQQGILWKTRNNFVMTHSSLHKTKSHIAPRTAREREMDMLLEEEKKFSDTKRSMLRSIKPHAKSVEKSDDLVKGMHLLRQMDLLSGKEMNHVKFPGIIKVEHVYNDYHLQTANPGFSRNYLGRFYTK